MRKDVLVFLISILTLILFNSEAQNVTVAAAADLRFAMHEVVVAYMKSNPGSKVDVIYGSSGNLYQQIVNQASFQIFFSADVSYARKLDSLKLTSGKPVLYAIGHLVLWSSSLDITGGIKALTSPEVNKIAIANPVVAPYGNRAIECLRHYRLYDRLRDKIVKGEDVSQAAQFLLTGNAEVGLIALSLALSPEMKSKGRYFILDKNSYSALEQAYVVLKNAATNDDVKKFIRFQGSEQARLIFRKFGFRLPGEN